MAKNKRVKEIGREGVVNYEKPTVPTNKKKTPRNAVYTNTREAPQMPHQATLYLSLTLGGFSQPSPGFFYSVEAE